MQTIGTYAVETSYAVGDVSPTERKVREYNYPELTREQAIARFKRDKVKSNAVRITVSKWEADGEGNVGAHSTVFVRDEVGDPLVRV